MSTNNHSWQVQLAKQTIGTYIKEDKVIKPPVGLPPEAKEKAGVFVSIHKGADLRGCIGTFLPMQQNIAEEIIANAIAAGTQDPRFPPILTKELPELEISVDVLSKPEPAKIDELDAKKYGIIVSCGGKRGLLLPDLEGVDTPEQQIAICRRKAWIDENAPVTLEKFLVKRYY
jgi:AmmeMemoRadiSam system protein A